MFKSQPAQDQKPDIIVFLGPKDTGATCLQLWDKPYDTLGYDDRLSYYMPRGSLVKNAAGLVVTFAPNDPYSFRYFQRMLTYEMVTGAAPDSTAVMVIMTKSDLLVEIHHTNPAYYQEILRNVDLVRALANKKGWLFYETSARPDKILLYSVTGIVIYTLHCYNLAHGKSYS
jgi:hypothetical protein